MILRLLITILSILLSAYLIPNVEVGGFWSAFWIALFMGLINVTLKPLLIVLTLPINILTLGLFIFVINGLMVLLASSVIEGFEVFGFLPAVIFSVVLTVMNYVLNNLLDAKM